MLVTTDTPYLHGITICDEQGKPLDRVQKFDTDTYLCWLRGGKRTVAAAYVIVCANEEQLQKCLGSLPDSMQQHIWPHLVANVTSDKTETARPEKFIQRQLDHRARLQELSRETD